MAGRTVVYEIDLPKVLEYKAETLAGHGATRSLTDARFPSTCAMIGPRHCATTISTRASRRHGWPKGCCRFCPQRRKSHVRLDRRLSGSGSRVAVEIFGADAEKRQEAEQRWAELKAKREARGQDTSFNPFDLWFDDEGRPDCPVTGSPPRGWTTRTANAREEATRLGREPQSEDRPFANSFVTATKALMMSGSDRIFLIALPAGSLGSRLSPIGAARRNRGAFSGKVHEKEGH